MIGLIKNFLKESREHRKKTIDILEEISKNIFKMTVENSKIRKLAEEQKSILDEILKIQNKYLVKDIDLKTKEFELKKLQEQLSTPTEADFRY